MTTETVKRGMYMCNYKPLFIPISIQTYMQ